MHGDNVQAASAVRRRILITSPDARLRILEERVMCEQPNYPESLTSGGEKKNLVLGFRAGIIQHDRLKEGAKRRLFSDQ